MSINKFNVTADKQAYGKWAELNKDYFANPKIIDEFFRFFARAQPILPRAINIIEFGSAEGLVGEYFAKLLSAGHRINLTILDVVPEHLQKNINPKTVKICKDLLQFDQREKYDLALARSLLHYFSFEDQLNALKIIHLSLKKGGYLLIAAFVQHPQTLALFLKLNSIVGKQLQLLPAEQIETLFSKSGFSSVSFLGDATTWNCSSNNLKLRYNLTQKQIEDMRSLIESTSDFKQKGFTLGPTEFTLPVPYKVYLLKKN